MKLLSHSRWILVLIVILLFQSPSADAASVQLKLKTTGTLAAGELVGGWSATLQLPSGLTARTVPGSNQLDATSFSASGVTPAAFTLQGSYNPPDENYAVSYLVLNSLGDASNPTNGTQPGEVATITLDLANGSPVPSKADFALSDTMIFKAAAGAPLATGLQFDFDLVTGIQTFTVTFSSGGNGTLSGTTSQTVNINSPTSQVSAVPSLSYHFVNWTGTGFTSTSNPLTINNVTSNMTITANFAADPVLNLTVSGIDNGTFIGAGSVHGDMVCDTTSACPATSFTVGFNATLTAKADNVSIFSGWSGNCLGLGNCNLTMDADKSVTASFAAAPKAKIGSAEFTSFANAYSAAASGTTTTIMLLEDTLPLSTGISKPLILLGGYLPSFTRSASGFTILHGTLSIVSGSLMVDRVGLN